MTVRLDLGGISFEWHLEKAWINKLKHGVDFREAATTFLDPDAKARRDDHHSASEERWTLIGNVEVRACFDRVVHLSRPVAQDHRLQDRECAGTP